MKKLNFLLLFMLLCIALEAQVYKTIDVTTSGTLSTLLTATELSTVTNLTVTGNIDARDVKTMRDDMPVLAVLDIVAVNIKAFWGYATNGSTPYPANEMPQFSFYNGITMVSKTTLTTIVLPNTVTSLGYSAFHGCTGLTDFLIPQSSHNFSSLNGVIFNKTQTTLILYPPGKQGSYNIPNSVLVIGDNAFDNCIGLTGGLTIPNLVTTIGHNAFSNCTGLLGSLTIPNSVITIGSSAFYNCIGFLGTLTLGEGVKSIGENAFTRCSGFKFINSLNTSPPLSSYSFNISPLIVYVPANGKAAYKSAVEWSGFNIVSVKHVTVNVPTAGSMVAVINGYGFGPLSDITHLTVTGNLNSMDFAQIKTNFTVLNKIDISGATLVGNVLPANAFQNKASLSFIALPSNVTSIGDNAFDGCISLSGDIPLPATVTSIGSYAYQGCASLTGNLALPSSISIINNYTFSGCSNISGSISLSNNITSVGSYAFNGCRILTGALSIPNNTTNVGASAFQNCKGLNGTISIGTELIYIADSTFAGCETLSGTLAIPNTITSIGANAFGGCEKLIGTLTLPNNIKLMGSNAFQNCSGFTGSLIIPNALTTISKSAFDGCIGLSGVLEMPLSVSSIGASAFKNCNKFTELILTKNITSIEENAFNGCISLSKITAPNNTPPIIKAATFSGVPVISCTLNVPTGAIVNYQNAAYWNNFFLFSEISPSGVPKLVSSNVKVYTTQSEIIIEGSSEGENISVYTLNGMHLQSVKSDGERLAIPAENGSAYLVKTAFKTFKVIL